MEPAEPTLHLLLVDDDEIDRMAVRRALTASGMTPAVREVTTVAEAVEALASEPFDCAIIDYNLPDGDGSGVLDAAREADDPVPCIVLTGQGDEGLAVDLMKEGARDYIPKGALSPDRLGQSLRSVIQVGRAEREARRARQGQQYLIDVSAELAGSLEYEDTVHLITRLAVPELADLAVLKTVDEEGVVHRVAATHRDPQRDDLEVGSVVTRGLEGDSTLVKVLRERKPVFQPEVDDAFLRAYAEDAAHLDHLRRFGPRSIVTLPLVARGRVLGALTLMYTDSGRRHDTHDFAVARNLASRAALALDNARLYADARRSAQARDEMLAVVSHDLRNPLNVIATSAALVLEIPLDEDKKRQQIEVIRRTTDRMNRLIQDLLDVTGMEAGKLSVNPERLPVDRMLEEACESMGTMAADGSVELRCDLLKEPVWVHADRERILQVFGNLVGNALKFTPAGGVVVVGARRDDGDVTFYVRDTGPGIPPEDVPHLFDRFWKGKNSTGTGLGLPIAKGIVEVHGGCLSLDTTPGEGTTFAFTLPAVREPSPRAEE